MLAAIFFSAVALCAANHSTAEHTQQKFSKFKFFSLWLWNAVSPILREKHRSSVAANKIVKTILYLFLKRKEEIRCRKLITVEREMCALQ